MLRGVLHPSEYKEILYQVAKEPEITYGTERRRSSIFRENLLEKSKKVREMIGTSKKLSEQAKEVQTLTKVVDAFGMGQVSEDSSSETKKNTTKNAPIATISDGSTKSENMQKLKDAVTIRRTAKRSRKNSNGIVGKDKLTEAGNGRLLTPRRHSDGGLRPERKFKTKYGKAESRKLSLS